MAENEYTSKFKIDITDLKKGMQQANQIMRVANSEFKAATGGMDKWGDSADGLSAKLKQLNAVHNAQTDKLELLEAEYKRVVQAEGESSKGAQDLYIKMNNLKGEIGKTESQIKTYSEKLDDMQRAQEQSENAANEQISTFDKLKQTISEQESELTALKGEYANVALEQGESSAEAQRLANEIQQLSGELVENKSKLSQAENAADQFDQSLDDVGDSAEDASGGFTIMKGALAALVADGIRKAAEAFKDLMTRSSEANANFQAETGASAEAMDEFSESIERVYSHNFGESMQDVASAMAEVKKQTGEIDPSKLEKMTESGIALRDTFGYDMTESVRAVNMLMRQFGLTSDEAFSFVVKGAQDGLDKNGDLLDTINEYSSYYKAQGYSADDFYNSLKNGAAAGTFSIDKLGDAMKEFGIRSKDTATTTTEGFELLGLNADQMREKFAKGGESAQEATKQTLEALFNMDDQVKQNQAGVDLFGTMWEDLGADGVKALMDISGEAATTSGAMKKLTDVKYDSVGSQISEIGRLFKTEMFQPLVDLILPAVQSVASFIIDHFNVMGPIITGVAAAFGVLGAALAIQGIINGVTKAFALLNLTMLANPIVLIAALIVGLVAAFVTLWIKCEAFRNFWKGLWDGIKNVTGIVVDAIVKFFTETLPAGFSAAVTFVGDFINSIIEWFQQLPAKIGEFISNVIASVTTWGSNMVAKAKEIGSNFLSGVVTFFQELPYNIGFIIGTVLGTIATWVINMVTKAHELGSNFLSAIVTFFTQLPGRIYEFITTAYTNVVTWASNMITKAKEAGSNFISNVINFIQQLPGKIYSFLQNVISNVIIWASNMKAKARQAGSDFISNVISFVQQLPGKIKSFLSDVISKLTTWVSDMGKKGKEGAKKLFDNVVNGLASLPGKMMDIGKSIVHGIWDGISNAADWLFGKIKDFAGGLVDGALQALGINSPSKVFRDMVGSAIPEGIAVGVNKNAKIATQSVKNLASRLVPVKDSILGDVSDAVSGNRLGRSSGARSGSITQNFYQYNNSPKALSRLEIYRQTRNQLKAAKGAL